MSRPLRLFTRADVDALIPQLDTLMGLAMERHGQATALHERLEDERPRIGGARGSAGSSPGSAPVDARDWKARAERLDGLTIEIRAALEEIQRLGGVVKDLGSGLVDFPGLVPDRGDLPVNLCWKHGEAAVRWWHGFDEGYAQRKPLP